MPQKKGFIQMLMRLPTRLVCLVMVALLALVAVHAILYTPKTDIADPGNLYVTTPAVDANGLPLVDANGNPVLTGSPDGPGFESDIMSPAYDKATGLPLVDANNPNVQITSLDFMKIAVVAGAIVGAIVLAWLFGFLPKKFPLLLFPVLGAAVAILFIWQTQLQPQGETKIMLDWMQSYWTETANGLPVTFTSTKEYIAMIQNAPYDTGYLLFLLPVTYLGVMLFGVDPITNTYAAFNNLVWMQYLSAVLLALAVYTLLRAAVKLFGKKTAFVAGLISVVCLPLALFSATLSSEIPALFFAAIAIERSVVYLKNEKRLGDGSYVFYKKNGFLPNILLATLALALAVLLKANYVVLAVTLAIVYLIDFLRNFRLKNVIMIAVAVALVAALFLGFYPTALLANNLFPTVVGAVGSADGSYYDSVTNPTAGNLQSDLINSATGVTSANIYTLLNEFLAQWIDPAFGLTYGMRGQLENWQTTGTYYTQDPANPALFPLGFLPTYLFYSAELDAAGNTVTTLNPALLTTIANAVQNIIYLFAILGILVCVFRASVERLILPLYVFGGMLFHFLLGANPMSSVPYTLALIVLAGYGLISLTSILRNRKHRDDPYHGIPRKRKI